MNHDLIPALSDFDLSEGLLKATNSPRLRHPKILHSPGAEFNTVFNFILSDSYMQPHMHPSSEKYEDIYLILGKLAILYFNNFGVLVESNVLEESKLQHLRVPAFTWHTYVMLSDQVITYETMNGIYDPITWKTMASWAPPEGTLEANTYLSKLKGAFI